MAQLLAKAKLTQLEKPLETLICEQFGLQAAPDYPIAAIAAMADGLDVGKAYWLRADAVNLVLQRDCFSLGEPIPLQINLEHAEHMIASLNQHFSQDGLDFIIGNSGAWYLRVAHSPQIKTSLPGVAAGKNIHQFMPQGVESSRWLAVLNEVQMLLFEHPANVVRENTGELAVNSVWFSGGGVMPQLENLQNNTSVLVADSVFYQGLATLAGIPYQQLPQRLDTMMQSNVMSIRMQMPHLGHLDEAWFKPLLVALKSKKIKELVLNLGFYEKSLVAEIKPVDFYRFWRTSMPVISYFN
ncbi:MAG: hypothetical protein CVU27_03730 [Betaproteobacteria bacterium HGW-Betaproteobacteria-20]|nr:MAG: hypothetical protein CVU27_03730 [Betaproteobacteria bacterium HGW-Betaproteobacteria-20]